MNANVTVSLSNELILRAEAWAKLSGQGLSEFLAKTIEVSLVPFVTSPNTISEWSDEEVLNVLNEQLLQADDRRLSELLRQQNNGQLRISDSTELQERMATYEQRLLVKSAVICEAVKRGLQQPPKS